MFFERQDAGEPKVGAQFVRGNYGDVWSACAAASLYSATLGDSSFEFSAANENIEGELNELWKAKSSLAFGTA
jgi:hypothetical protein